VPTLTATASATPTATVDTGGPLYRAEVAQTTTLHAGPGITYASPGVLNVGEVVQVQERNATGIWVRVQRPDAGTAARGWVMSAHLALNPELRFSRLPVNRSVPDADVSQFSTEVIAPLYRTPIIPLIAPAMQAVYRRGQSLGNQAGSVTKVGDSVTANPIYLNPMRFGNHELGAYDYLDATIRFFGPSLTEDSVAARKGLSSFGVFDPLNAARRCNANEAPLTCEYRLKRPSVAFIMFGPNDIWRMTAEEFRGQMRQIIEVSLDQGIIPVLTTFSTDPRRRSWEPSVGFNLALLELAQEYQVPLMNLWLASRDLPDYGLEGDGIHMKNYGYNQIKFDAGLETRFGTNLQNLLAIRTLDEIRRTIIQPGS
jgi:hypothetical protein